MNQALFKAKQREINMKVLLESASSKAYKLEKVVGSLAKKEKASMRIFSSTLHSPKPELEDETRFTCSPEKSAEKIKRPSHTHSVQINLTNGNSPN